MTDRVLMPLVQCGSCYYFVPADADGMPDPNHVCFRADPSMQLVRLKEHNAALQVERLRAERDLLRAEVRTAFDAAFTLGAAFGCGLSNNAEAARKLECVPTAAFCDEVWAKWQAKRAAVDAFDKEGR